MPPPSSSLLLTPLARSLQHSLRSRPTRRLLLVSVPSAEDDTPVPLRVLSICCCRAVVRFSRGRALRKPVLSPRAAAEHDMRSKSRRVASALIERRFEAAWDRNQARMKRARDR